MAQRIVAIVCVRNEEWHVGSCLESFFAEGIDVVLIDHDSTDGTRAAAERYLGRGLLGLVHMPWKGAFSLSDQLRVKAAVARHLDTDWLIHADADEWLQAPEEFASLREGIEAADRDGYNCINFDEFVFLPPPGGLYEGTRYRAMMRRYYFFEPSPCRLMRAWKARSDLRILQDGGHRIGGGPLDVFPRSFILRHYIVLSAAHAVAKYERRTFSREDLARGWHGNRLGLDERNLVLPEASSLERLSAPQARDFSKARPLRTHYWEWQLRQAS